MSLWYKKSESSSRISIFFLGNLLASATVALIGAGILNLSGRHGVAGWRWLFIGEFNLALAWFGRIVAWRRGDGGVYRCFWEENGILMLGQQSKA